MVTFRLVEENEYFISYWYFPNGNEKNGHGLIVIDKQKHIIYVAKLAPDDFSYEVSVEEQNAMRDSVNALCRAEGTVEQMHEEWPLATNQLFVTAFADHALQRIEEAYNSGTVLPDGMVMWY